MNRGGYTRGRGMFKQNLKGRCNYQGVKPPYMDGFATLKDLVGQDARPVCRSVYNEDQGWTYYYDKNGRSYDYAVTLSDGSVWGIPYL